MQTDQPERGQQVVVDQRDIGKADEQLRMGPHQIEVDTAQHPQAAVAAAHGEDRRGAIVGKGPVQFFRPGGIAVGKKAAAGPQPLGITDDEPHLVEDGQARAERLD